VQVLFSLASGHPNPKPTTGNGKVFIFEILASGTDFQNTGLSQASAKLAVKYWPGR